MDMCQDFNQISVWDKVMELIEAKKMGKGKSLIAMICN